MNEGNIWWEKLPAAAKFLESAAAALADGRQVVLRLPAAVPWHAAMRARLAVCLDARLDGRRSFLELSAAVGGSPGEYLREHFSRPGRKARFRPVRGDAADYARFLASAENSTLSNYDLLLYDADEASLAAWEEFLVAYRQALGGEAGCACLIETRVAGTAPRGIQDIAYDDFVTPYDDFIFYLVLAREAQVRAVYREYLAALAAGIAGHDVELGAALLSRGEAFLMEPEQTAAAACGEQRASGAPFAAVSPAACREAVWLTQLKQIFPALERYRRQFLARHEAAVRACLPATNSFGEPVTEPAGVELGLLYFFFVQGRLRLTAAEGEQLTHMREARNRIAHMQALPFAEVRRVLAACS